MYEYGTTREQFARLVMASHQWAALNPRAARRGTITVEEVIASPPIVSPIHRLDACLVSDAGGAFVVTSEERARDLAGTPVAFPGAGHAFTHRSIAQREDITTTGAVESARRACEASGVGLDEVDVFEIYDAFSTQLLVMLEDIGLCPKGEGGPYVEETELGPGGDVALNTSGGGLSYLIPGCSACFWSSRRYGNFAASAGSARFRARKPPSYTEMAGSSSARSPPYCAPRADTRTMSGKREVQSLYKSELGKAYRPTRAPESEPFWAGCAEGRMVVPRCEGCRRFHFYPRRFCPYCDCEDIEWREASGAGIVYSFAIVEKPIEKAFSSLVPYVIAIVELEEGIRMRKNFALAWTVPW